LEDYEEPWEDLTFEMKDYMSVLTSTSAHSSGECKLCHNLFLPFLETEDFEIEKLRL